MAYPDFIRPKERAIIDKIVKRALEEGCLISVKDEVSTAVQKSSDYEAITKEIAQTDFTTLTLYDHTGKLVFGSIFFVHGNDEDVVCDFTDTPKMNFIVGEQV